MAKNLRPADTLIPVNCPKCGDRLHVCCEKRVGEDAEPVSSYLCYEHGFFTFDIATGLRPGLVDPSLSHPLLT